MKILYRIAESTNPEHVRRRTWQVVPEYATKKSCLLSVMAAFPSAEIIVFVDSITEDTWQWLNSIERLQIQKISAGSEAKSMRILLEYAAALPDENEIVLLQEDDYVYLPNLENELSEALEYSDYVTGYLHPDKFWNPAHGGNPYNTSTNISEQTMVVKTTHRFWMMTNSTTCTFATTVKVIREDMDIWMNGTSDLIGTQDFKTFVSLRDKGRTLLQPLPSISSHCLQGFEAPLTGLSISSWADATIDK